MRLATFISQNKEQILQEFEDFARTIKPAALTMSRVELRDHASQMIDTFVEDLNTYQSDNTRVERARGQQSKALIETYAEVHASERLKAGYTVNQLVSEYRAMRSSVLRLWAKSPRGLMESDTEDVMRFHEAIDQALAESVCRFSEVTTALADNERSRLDAILDAAPVGIAVVDAAGTINIFNPENKRLWGPPPEAAAKDFSLWNAWWADGSERHGTPLGEEEWPLVRALKGEKSHRDCIEIEPFDQAGSRRTVLNHAVPIYDSRQQIVGAVAAMVEITDQVKAEAALRESEEKFRTIANAMPQMVWSTLPDGFHDYYNQQWYVFTGVPEGSTNGKEWNGMFHADDQERAWKLWTHSLATGDLYEIQYRLRHRSGEFRWVLGRALPVRDKLGAITRWMGTCTDIHDQKMAEDEIRKTSRAKDEFLAMLAHELRNPLAPISTAAKMLNLFGPDEPRLKNATEVISRQVQHMVHLIDDLMDVSRVTRGLVELDRQSVDLKGVVYSAIEQSSPNIEARRHELSTHIPSGPIFVQGDKTRLVQVLVNLLNNAAKYSPQEGHITLSMTTDGKKAEITVADNGSGIDASLLPNIFDLFAQGERTPDRSQGGLGIGLTLVKTIVGLHGGSVGATSRGLGKGSEFTVVLPLQEMSKTLLPIQPDRESNLRVFLQVLVVDDNSDAANSLADVLRARGHSVVVKETADEALDVAKHEPFDAYVLDIGLPGMNGYEMTRRLRSDPATSKALIIALTGYGQEHDRILSKAAGFDHHLVKPVDLQKLDELLSSAEVKRSGYSK